MGALVKILVVVLLAVTAQQTLRILSVYNKFLSSLRTCGKLSSKGTHAPSYGTHGLKLNSLPDMIIRISLT